MLFYFVKLRELYDLLEGKKKKKPVWLYLWVFILEKTLLKLFQNVFVCVLDEPAYFFFFFFHCQHLWEHAWIYNSGSHLSESLQPVLANAYLYLDSWLKRCFSLVDFSADVNRGGASISWEKKNWTKFAPTLGALESVQLKMRTWHLWTFFWWWRCQEYLL